MSESVEQKSSPRQSVQPPENPPAKKQSVMNIITEELGKHVEELPKKEKRKPKKSNMVYLPSKNGQVQSIDFTTLLTKKKKKLKEEEPPKKKEKTPPKVEPKKEPTPPPTPPIEESEEEEEEEIPESSETFLGYDKYRLCKQIEKLQKQLQSAKQRYRNKRDEELQEIQQSQKIFRENLRMKKKNDELLHRKEFTAGTKQHYPYQYKPLPQIKKTFRSLSPGSQNYLNTSKQNTNDTTIKTSSRYLLPNINSKKSLSPKRFSQEPASFLNSSRFLEDSSENSQQEYTLNNLDGICQGYNKTRINKNFVETQQRNSNLNNILSENSILSKNGEENLTYPRITSQKLLKNYQQKSISPIRSMRKLKINNDQENINTSHITQKSNNTCTNSTNSNNKKEIILENIMKKKEKGILKLNNKFKDRSPDSSSQKKVSKLFFAN